MELNLSKEIRTLLPSVLNEFLHNAGEIASRRKEKLYLVGGVVRDILIRRQSLDIDLAVEGDAAGLASDLAKNEKWTVVYHRAFNTATIRWLDWNVHIATARSEIYIKPGALPIVKPATIDNDLFRRDFTINAMAVSLEPKRFGELIDLYNGVDDLKAKIVRIIHESSFRDDATRIWRALRYEQRLDFKIEKNTLRLIKQDLEYLRTISGDRIRNELKLALEEAKPEKILKRAGNLGILVKLHPSIKADGWLSKKFKKVREYVTPTWIIYLALMVYRMKKVELNEFSSYLNLPKNIYRDLQDTIGLKRRIIRLSNKKLKPSRVYALLSRFSLSAIRANLIVTDAKIVRDEFSLYLNKLRYVRTSIKGDDLLKLGVPEGPTINKMLRFLQFARLDGKTTTREEEEILVKRLLSLLK